MPSLSPPPAPPTRPDDEPALICAIAGNWYAVPLTDVVEVTRSVAVTTPSGDNDAILGYIDFRGDLVPVISARRALTLPERPVSLSDRFVVVRVGSRLTAIQVDAVEGVGAVAVPVDPVASSRSGLAVTRHARASNGSAMLTRLEVRRMVPASDAVDLAAGNS